MDNLVKEELVKKIKKIKMVFTDNDGVLTDTGIYYSEKGEQLKRYSVRDGMGFERLRKISKIYTGIITSENSELIRKRAKKLKVEELYSGIKKKDLVLADILQKHSLRRENIAYIGDDVNDIEILKLVGFSAAPSDALKQVKDIVDYVCENKGGHGAFREFADLIIELKNK